MELKDAILQTLAEIDEVVKLDTTAPSKEEVLVSPSVTQNFSPETLKVLSDELPAQTEVAPAPSIASLGAEGIASERLFLSHAKDRLIVLFEGLNTPGVTGLDAKLDLTLNFLEYLLASIDERLERIDS
jgi:hypothetical protein